MANLNKFLIKIIRNDLILIEIPKYKLVYEKRSLKNGEKLKRIKIGSLIVVQGNKKVRFANFSSTFWFKSRFRRHSSSQYMWITKRETLTANTF